jgi:hypothetical protein
MFAHLVLSPVLVCSELLPQDAGLGFPDQTFTEF